MKPILPQTAVLATLKAHHSLLIRPDAWQTFAEPLYRLHRLGQVHIKGLPEPCRLKARPDLAVFSIPDAEDPSNPNLPPWRVVWNLGGPASLEPDTRSIPPEVRGGWRDSIKETLKASAKGVRQRLTRVMAELPEQVSHGFPELLPGVWLVPQGTKKPTDSLQIAYLQALDRPIGHRFTLDEPDVAELLRLMNILRLGEGMRVATPPLQDLNLPQENEPDYLEDGTPDFRIVHFEENGVSYADFWRRRPRQQEGLGKAAGELIELMQPGNTVLLPAAIADRILPSMRAYHKSQNPDRPSLVTRKDHATGGTRVWMPFDDPADSPKTLDPRPVMGLGVTVLGHDLNLFTGHPIPAYSKRAGNFNASSAEGYPVLQPGQYIEIGTTPEAEALVRTWRQRMTRAKMAVRVAATPYYAWYIQRLAPSHATQPEPVKADPAHTMMTGGGTVAEALAKHLPPQPEPQP